MSKELATQTGGALVSQGHAGGEEILSSAIVIPRLLLMQGLSDFVTDGKAVMGELIRANNVEKLGGPDKPIDFIPLTFKNFWTVREKVGAKYEWRGKEPMTASNQDLPWEYEDKGTQWKRVKTLDLFALLVHDLEGEKAELAKAAKGEMPDPDKALLPILISFQSYSFGSGGKAIHTHFAKAKKFNVPGFVSVMRLKARKDKNDKGTFYILDVETVGKTPPVDLKTCEYWYSQVAQNNVIVEGEDGDEPEATAERGSF